MYLYNVTINIDDAVHDKWLQWMRNKHIPDMLATQKFLGARLCKVLSSEDENGTTYAIQYKTKDKATLQRYYQENAEAMRREGRELFGDAFVAFRTELQILEEQFH